ncbi:hypothetical protein AMECASPLE_009823 [Ameca splendens]|uniref:UPAR/Ly6 domain-containing protein n=1 Tax=Ameca splendens TaxID=208324 RepID=A0ABV0YME7_9TELE
MGSQRNNRVDIPLSSHSWHQTSTLLLSALLLLASTVGSLLCNFCPLQHKSKSCKNFTSECLPHQRCFSSWGRYGSVHVLSSQGCLDAELCDSYEMVSYRGVKYNISRTCCSRDVCNIAPQTNTSLMDLLGMIKNNLDYTATTLIMEEPWDSSENYTAPSPAIK